MLGSRVRRRDPGIETIEGSSAGPGRPIASTGDDLDAFEQTLRSFSPAGQAYDLKLMVRVYQQQGAAATLEELERLTALMGNEPRSYREFAEEVAAEWRV